jgi:tetratricopeptide (TPR) repeat protein
LIDAGNRQTGKMRTFAAAMRGIFGAGPNARGSWLEVIRRPPGRRPASAQERYDKALWFQHWRGQKLARLGRVDDALLALDRAIELSAPADLADCYVARAIVLVGARRFLDAIAAYSMALDLYNHDDYPNLPKLVSIELQYIADELAKSANLDKNKDMSDAASALMAAAERFGLPEDVVKAIGSLAVDAARETTDRAAAPMRVVIMEDKTLGRLQRRYEKRLAEIELPPEGFIEPAQAKAAKNLEDDFRRLRERLVERGLPPIEKDWRVTEAARLRGKFERAYPVKRRPRTRSKKSLSKQIYPSL